MKTTLLVLLPLLLIMLGGCTAVQDKDAAAPDAAAGAQQAAGTDSHGSSAPGMGTVQGTCSMRHSTLSCGGVPVVSADAEGRLSASVKILNGWGQNITITDMVCTQGEEPAATTCDYGSVDTGNYTDQIIAPGSAYDGVLPCYVTGTTDRATGRAGGQFSGTVVLWYQIVDGTDQPSRRDVMTIATTIR
jgi:uncharacterized protein YceK